MFRSVRLLRHFLLIFAFTFPVAGYADELLISAAASLTNAFQEIGEEFEHAHSGVKLSFNFAASGQLLQQIAQGAPADVFASADTESMDKGIEQQLISNRSAIFASNKLVLIVPVDSTVVVASLQDLTKPEFKHITVGNPASVPVGRYTKSVLDPLKLWDALSPRLVYADSVRQALSYVVRGEVEAGFVYATDAIIEKNKVKVALEVPTPKPIKYPIAPVAASKNAQLADDFISFVLQPAGQQILAKYGFGKP